MPSNTVTQFADELNIPAQVLLEQLRTAGVELQSVQDEVTDADRAKLLDSLRRAHGSSDGKKITLTRRQTSEIRQADSSGRSRTIQVEVRKKRVFVKRDPAELLNEARAQTAALAPSAEPAQDLKPDEAQAAPPIAPALSEATLVFTDASATKAAPQAEDIVQTADQPDAAAVTPVVETSTSTSQPVTASATTEAPAAAQDDADAAASAEAVSSPAEHATPNEAGADATQSAAVPETEAFADSTTTAPEFTAPQAASPADATKSASVAPAKRASTTIPRVLKPTEVKEAAPVDEARERARRKAENEAAALREMLSRPRKVLKAPETPPPTPLTGTLHKSAAAKKDAKPAAGDSKKTIKAADMSSSWGADGARKKPAAKDAAACGRQSG